jgi:hypothetical protein
VLRWSGWHFKVVTHFSHCIDTLTTTGDLRAAFPGSSSQRRLRFLFESTVRSSRSRVWIAAAEKGLARWFGPHVWAPIAFERSLTIAVVYPVVTLLFVWAFSGQGRIGTVDVVAGGAETMMRWIAVASLFFGTALLVWLYRSLVKSTDWLLWTYLAMFRVLGVVIGAFTVAAAFAGIYAGAYALGYALALVFFVAIVFVLAFVLTFGVVRAFRIIRAKAISVTVARFFSISAAFVFGGSGIGIENRVGDVAGAASGLGAVAFVVAVIFVGSDIGAGSVAISIATAVAVALAVSGYGAVAVAKAVAISCFVALLLLKVRTLMSNRIRWGSRKFRLIALVLGWYIGLMVTAWQLPHWAGSEMLNAYRPPFLWFYFLGLVPIWNATLDLISVGLTRLFLRRYLRIGTGWWWMVVIDVVTAVVLTVLLFWGALAALLLLQYWGWGIDAASLVRQFRADPTDPQVEWLTWMALTNILPTLLHLSLACAGLWSGWLLRDVGFTRHLLAQRNEADALFVVSEAIPPFSAESGLVLKAPLSKPQAALLANWVYVDFWLGALLPPAVVVACWPAWQWLMEQALHLLP